MDERNRTPPRSRRVYVRIHRAHAHAFGATFLRLRLDHLQPGVALLLLHWARQRVRSIGAPPPFASPTDMEQRSSDFIGLSYRPGAPLLLLNRSHQRTRSSVAATLS